MFGEMVGAALADCWKRAGRAGRRDLCRARARAAARWPRDALRVLRAAGFAGEVHFVETSPVLRELQQASRARRALARRDRRASRDGRCCSSPTNSSTRCRSASMSAASSGASLIAAGGLAFDRDGEIVETSPARDEAVAAIATCLAAKGGVALIIDYGHERSAPGDTLQAVRGHRFAPVLANPGEQDLTAHVDFEAVADAAREAGAAVTPVVAAGRMADPARHRSARAGAVARQSRARRATIAGRARPPHRPRSDGRACSRSSRSIRRTGRRRRASHDDHLSRRHAARRCRDRPHLRHELLRHLRAPLSARGPRGLPGEFRRSTPGQSELDDPALSPSASPRSTASSVGYVKLGPIDTAGRDRRPALRLRPALRPQGASRQRASRRR